MVIEIIPYDRRFIREHFSCGQPSLDNYIQRNVTNDITARACTCFVIVDNDRVKAYYTLSNESVPIDGAPDQLRKKIKYDQIPVTLLGRLAVHEDYKGQGLGKLLLIDAIKRSFYVAEEHVASKAVIVDPIDEAAVAFYAKYGFTTIPDTGRMFMTMNKIREALQTK